jgi:hypothetical protein
VIRRVAAGLVLVLSLAGCSGAAASGSSAPPKPVHDDALGAVLLGVDEVNAILGTTGVQPHPLVEQMADHRTMLPNLDCLGVWQVNEAPIYESSNWKSVQQQLLRSPDTDNWDSLVVQSVVSYRTADAARTFFDESADRWSRCTNHNVNVSVNGQKLPAWKSGDLATTDNQLAMPYTRGSGAAIRSCQHVLAVAANVIIDVAACGPQSPDFTKGADVAAKIEAKFPR